MTKTDAGLGDSSPLLTNFFALVLVELFQKGLEIVQALTLPMKLHRLAGHQTQGLTGCQVIGGAKQQMQ